MNLVVVGHVDHGKSTLIGRLLADTGSLPKGKLEQVRSLCERTSKPFEYAFLLDALKDERAQGITIDSARIFFSSQKREYKIVDAPGHIEFLKNMISGAAQAQAAVIVIDAHEGIKENSKRHGTLLSLLGIEQVTVVINKMDAVNYDHEVFEKVQSEYSKFLEGLGIKARFIIPTAALHGENVFTGSNHMSWYHGPTLLEALDQFEEEAPLVNQDFRMPVQDVYKFTAFGDTRRIIAGTIASGQLKVGDELIFSPSGKKARVQSLENFPRGTLSSAHAGQATGITLDEAVYVARGEVASKSGEQLPSIIENFTAEIFWLSTQPFDSQKSYKIKIHNAQIMAKVVKIHSSFNPTTLELNNQAKAGFKNEIIQASFHLQKPIACDTEGNSVLTRFVIVDQYEIVGGGLITKSIVETTKPKTQEFILSELVSFCRERNIGLRDLKDILASIPDKHIE